MLLITCGHCKKMVPLKDAYAGLRIRCPGCLGVLTVPNVQVSARPAPSAVQAGRGESARTPPPPTRPSAPRFTAPPVATNRRTEWNAGTVALVLLLLLALTICFVVLHKQASPSDGGQAAPKTFASVLPAAPPTTATILPVRPLEPIIVAREDLKRGPVVEDVMTPTPPPEPPADPVAARPVGDTRTARFVTELKSREWLIGPVEHLTYSPDASRALFVTRGNSIQLWDVGEVKELYRLNGHTERVTSLTFSPDGTQALSGGEDRTVRLWDLNRGVELHRIASKGPVARGSFSPDGKRVLTGYETVPGGQITLQLWNLLTWQEVTTVEEWTTEWVRREVAAVPGPVVTSVVEVAAPPTAVTKTVTVPAPPTYVETTVETPVYVPSYTTETETEWIIIEVDGP